MKFKVGFQRKPAKKQFRKFGVVSTRKRVNPDLKIREVDVQEIILRNLTFDNFTH